MKQKRSKGEQLVVVVFVVVVVVVLRTVNLCILFIHTF